MYTLSRRSGLDRFYSLQENQRPQVTKWPAKPDSISTMYVPSASPRAQHSGGDEAAHDSRRRLLDGLPVGFRLGRRTSVDQKGSIRDVCLASGGRVGGGGRSHVVRLTEDTNPNKTTTSEALVESRLLHAADGS